jgi:hypothetical protein
MLCVRGREVCLCFPVSPLMLSAYAFSLKLSEMTSGRMPAALFLDGFPRGDDLRFVFAFPRVCFPERQVFPHIVVLCPDIQCKGHVCRTVFRRVGQYVLS